MRSIRRRSRALAYVLSLLVVASAAWMPTAIFAQVLPGSPFGSSSGGSGLSYPLLDNAFEVCDEADTTKCVQVSAGGITTANDVVVTLSGAAATPTWTATGWTLNIGDGTVGAPALAWQADADGTGTGIFRPVANAVGLVGNGVEIARATASQFRVATFPFCGGGNLASCDVLLAREGAAIWQLGTDVNGAAVAQTLKAHDGITGTDIAGANFTLAGGRGTGAGAGGNFIEQTAVTLATGTTAQTLADRRVVVAKPKALTAASATAVVEIGVPQGTVAGGTIEYTIRANDATNYQARSGVLVYSAVNPAGTEACTLSRPDGGTTVDNTTDSIAASSGTLTNTFTCTIGLTDVVQIAANAASSLTETVLQITYEVRRNEGSGVITPQ